VVWVKYYRQYHHHHCIFHPAQGYRPPTNAFHSNLSLASILIFFHTLPILLTSLSRILLFPWGFQSRVILAMFFSGFLRVCPMHRYHLLPISVPIGTCWVLSHTSSFLNLSVHLILSRCLRHLLMKVYKWFVQVFFVDQGPMFRALLYLYNLWSSQCFAGGAVKAAMVMLYKQTFYWHNSLKNVAPPAKHCELHRL